MKLRKLLSLVLAIVMVLGCMSVTAFAESEELTNQTTKQVWSSGTYTVTSGTVTLSAGVEIQGDVTLNIADGATLNILGTAGSNGVDGSGTGSSGTNGGDGGAAMIISSGSLTITCDGTLNVTGGNGGNGGNGTAGVGESSNGGAGGAGGAGGNGMTISSGSVTIICDGTINVTGGNSGNGGNGGNGGNYTRMFGGSGGNGGHTGRGGTGIKSSGSVTIKGSGTLNVSGGNGGNGGNGGLKGDDLLYEAKNGNTGASGGAGYGIDGKTGSMTIDVTGTLNLQGGTIGTGGTLENAVPLSINNDFTVIGGTVKAMGPNPKIYISGTGNFNIQGGTVISGWLQNQGCIFITDGVFTLTQDASYISGSMIISGGKNSTTHYFISTSVSYAVTGGLFNIDMTTYVSDGYYCTANIDPATKDTYGYIVLPVENYQLVSVSDGLSEGKTGGVSFAVGGNDVTYAKENDVVSASAIPVKGYAVTLSAKDGDNADVTFKSNENGVATFDMPKKGVIVSATYTWIGYDLKSESSLSGEGGVTFKKGNDTVTTADPGDEITVIANAVDGCSAALSSDDVTITDGKFTMIDDEVSVKVTYYVSLDMETDTTYADSKELEQKYTFKQTSESYTDVTKVKIEWTVSDISATYKNHKTWDPNTLTWVEAKEDVAASNQTATFKITNYSSTDVKVNVAFAVEDEVKDTYDATNSQFDNNDCTVKTPVVQDTTTTYTEASFTEKTQTITATLVFKKDEFAKLDATTQTSQYGTYTVTISEAK